MTRVHQVAALRCVQPIEPAMAVATEGHAKGQHFSNVTTVTIIALVALLDLAGSHFAMYIKIIAALLVISMWFMVYRYREEGPVVGATLLGLLAIMILSGGL